MAKCRVARAGSDTAVNEVVSWSREEDTKYYWRSTQEVTTDTALGTNKKTGKPIRDEKPCTISDESDYDHSMQYTGLDGNLATMYFKVDEEWQAS